MDIHAGPYVYDAEKSALMDLVREHGVTLDGLPAVLGGRALLFALVGRLDGKGGAVEFSWAAARKIIRKAISEGRVPDFKS